jgi:6-phosphogluconolactonase (cycloisomerase 2 family)
MPIAYRAPACSAALSANPFNYPMFDLQGEPTGQFMIGTTGETAIASGVDDDHLYVFQIGSTGGISPVLNSPFSTVSAPYNISVQPANPGANLVYSLPDPDQSIPMEGYRLDSGGQLTAVAGSPFTINATLWGNFDPSGNYYVLYNSDSHFGSLTDFAVGSNGGLTLGPQVTLASSGYWALVEP